MVLIPVIIIRIIPFHLISDRYSQRPVLLLKNEITRRTFDQVKKVITKGDDQKGGEQRGRKKGSGRRKEKIKKKERDYMEKLWNM